MKSDVGEVCSDNVSVRAAVVGRHVLHTRHVVLAQNVVHSVTQPVRGAKFDSHLSKKKKRKEGKKLKKTKIKGIEKNCI